MGLVDRLSMPESHRETLLEFTRLILPPDNNLPNSYYQIKKSIPTPNITEITLCKLCNELVIHEKGKKKQCKNEFFNAFEKN